MRHFLHEGERGGRTVGPMLLVMGLLAAGCGREDVPDRGSAADRTKLDTLAMEEGLTLGKPLLVVEDLPTPESAAVGPDGRYYVSLIGEFGKEGDGAVVVLDPETGAKTPYASGLFDPTGLAFKGDILYAADRNGVIRIAPGGEVSVFASADDFPRKPTFLNDVEFDAAGDLLVSDSGDLESKGGAIFRIAPDGRVSLLAGSDTIPELATVNGLARGRDGIYAVGFRSGALYVTNRHGGWRKVGEGFGTADGLAFDRSGRLYVTDHEGGSVYVAEPQRGEELEPRKLAEGLEGAADLAVDEERRRLVVPELRGNRVAVYALPGARP